MRPWRKPSSLSMTTRLNSRERSAAHTCSFFAMRALAREHRSDIALEVRVEAPAQERSSREARSWLPATARLTASRATSTALMVVATCFAGSEPLVGVARGLHRLGLGLGGG